MSGSNTTTHGKNNTRQGKHFTAYESGTRTEWPDHSLEFPGLGTVRGKHFLKDRLGFTGCEISINSLPPNAGMPFYHTHQKTRKSTFSSRAKDKCRLMEKSLM